MDQGSLVTELIDAGAKFLAEFQKYTPVRAAFWTKEVQDYPTDWYLYLAADRFAGGDNFDGYGEVVRLSQRWRDDPNFDGQQVNLVGTDHSFARDVLKLLDRYPGPIPIRRGEMTLGGESVAGLYVYPRPLLAASRVA